jgi:hypothetical protein
LRGGLLELKKQEESEDVIRRAKRMLSKFCGVVWPMFGRLALTVFVSGVAAEGLGGQLHISEEARRAELQLAELLNAFELLGANNKALRLQIEEETNALNALQGHDAQLQGGKHTFLRIKVEVPQVQSQVKSVQYFSKPNSTVGRYSGFTKKAMYNPSGRSTGMSHKIPKKFERAPIQQNPSKRCRSVSEEEEEEEAREEEEEEEEGGTTLPKDVPLPYPKGKGLQAKTMVPASGISGVKKKGRGIFTDEMDIAIQEGVVQQGQHGNIKWKKIKNQHPELFGGMTAAQLKDRNKNLEKQKKAQGSYS